MQQAFGIDVSNENFTETPSRVRRAYSEIFAGAARTEEKVSKILASGFPCQSSEMVIVRDVRVFSMCPHHLLPVDYNIHVAYIPSVGGRVLGISKLPRLVELLAKRPVLQEELVFDVTNKLMTVAGVEGAACLAYGTHYCMAMRGAKQENAVTITSSMTGLFMDDPAVRSEFLSLVKR
jgi:GTP cyclohydrolase I